MKRIEFKMCVVAGNGNCVVAIHQNFFFLLYISRYYFLSVMIIDIRSLYLISKFSLHSMRNIPFYASTFSIYFNCHNIYKKN